jgi:uncharacterized glyoxalase superfamily protein PhnB
MAIDQWKATDIVPSLAYSGLPRAIKWLTRVFRFHERQNARLTWPGGRMAWMEVSDGLLNIATPDSSWGQDSGTSRSGFVLKVYVDDVDAHFVHAKYQGATIVSEPENGFWGGRIYRVRDHEGHRWEISQRGWDAAEKLWALPPGVTRGVNP